MPSEQRDGQNGSESRSPALIAGPASIVWSVLELGHRSIAALRAKPLIIASVRPLSKTEDVWCITVPCAEEFSLANGALVHNCSHPADAFRMLAVAERRRVAAIAKPARPLVEEFADVRRSTLDELWAEKEAAESRRVRI
jgi:hypothetical protein